MSEGSRNTGEFASDIDERVDLLINRGLELFQNGDLQGAVSEWEHALALKSDSPVAREYIEYVRRHFEGAITSESGPPVRDFVDDIPFPPEGDAELAEYVAAELANSSASTLPGRPVPPRPAAPVRPSAPMPPPRPAQKGAPVRPSAPMPRPTRQGPPVTVRPPVSSRPVTPRTIKPRAQSPVVLEALTPAERRQLEASAARERVVPLPPDEPSFSEERDEPLRAARGLASEFADHLPTRSDGLVAVDGDDDASGEFDHDTDTGARTAEVQRNSLGFVRATTGLTKPHKPVSDEPLAAPGLTPIGGEDEPTIERGVVEEAWQGSSSGPSPRDPDAAFDFGGDANDPFGFAAIAQDQAHAAVTDAPVITENPVDLSEPEPPVEYHGEYRPDESARRRITGGHDGPTAADHPPVMAELHEADPEQTTRPVPTSTSLEQIVAQLSAEIDASAPASESDADRLRRRLDGLLARAFEERDHSRYPLAVTLLDMLFNEDPDSAITQKIIHSHRDEIADIYLRYLGDTGAVPRLAISMTDIPITQIDSRAAFLISRIDGVLSIDDLLDVSGMSRIETFRYLCRLRLRGIVAV